VDRWLWWGYGVVATILYALVSILSYQRFDVHSWDLAIFEQAIKAYSQFEAPIVLVKGPEYNILGDHFSPVTALIAPFYKLFPSAYTLLVAQAVLIGLSVVVIARLAIQHLGGWWGSFFAVLYATSFGIQAAVSVDFHEVAFAVPLLAMAGAAFVNGKFDRVIWWSLPLFLVKEDLGMTVAAIGVALWFAGERRRGFWLGLVGLLGTFLIVFLVIPYFNNGGEYDYVGTLGGESGVVSTLVSGLGTKLLTVLITLGVGGLAVFGSPWIIAIVPTLAWRFVGDVEFYWGTEWHYSLVLMPIVFIAMIDTHIQKPQWRWANALIAIGFAGWMLQGSAFHQLANGDAWGGNARAQAAHRVLDEIPEGSYVEADIGLLSHLVSKHNVYWRGTIGQAQPDYIVFDKDLSTDDIIGYAWQAHNREFAVIYEDGFFVIARRAGLK